MPGARWFDGAQLNYAEALLRRVVPDRPALLFASERNPLQEVSGAELRAAVTAAAAGLRRLGVGRGDRVVAMHPEHPRGGRRLAGARQPRARSGRAARRTSARAAVIDRFAQIEPKVLIAVDGYTYGGKPFDRARGRRELRADLPTLEHTVVVPYLDRRRRAADAPGDLRWADLLGRAGRAAHLRGRAVRPPALGPVLVGHDRPAQGDRPRPRRRRARARQGARPASATSAPATACSGTRRPAG